MIFSHFIIKNRVWIIIAIIIITVFFALYALKLNIDSDVLNTLPKNDINVQTFNYIGDTFNGNHIAVIVIEGNIISNNILKNIHMLTDSLDKMDFGSIISLTSITDMRNNNGILEIGPLIDRDELPLSNDELDSLIVYIKSNDDYRGTIISNDMQSSLLLIKLSPLVDKTIAAEQIESITNHFFPENTRFGGQPFLIKDINIAITKDLKLLIPILCILIISVLGISFRSLRGITLPLLSVVISIIWTIGLMALLNKPFTLISNIIPVVLLAVGSAYSIHLLSRYNEDTNFGKTRIEHTEYSFSQVVLPIILAGLTTFIGFISFIFGSFLLMIRDFGIFASIGVLFALLISITLTPAILSFLPNKKKRGEIVFTPLNHLNRFIVRHPVYVLSTGIIIVMIMFSGLFFIERKVDIADYFDKDTYTSQSAMLIREKFGGSDYIQILVQGNLRDSTNLAKMDILVNRLKKEKDIHNVSAISEVIKKINNIVEGKKIIPSNRKIGNLCFLIEGDKIIANLINTQFNEGLVQASFENGMQVKRVNVFIKEYDPLLDSLSNENIKFIMSGMPLLNIDIDRSIIRSQITSLLIASLFIFIILCILLKNAFAGLIGMIPIAFTLIVIFGIMGLFKIPLDIATALVGSITIGIGIDYTIHFLERLKKEKHENMRDRVLATLNSSGRAIFINMLTVASGFLVLTFAELVPLRRFGLLTAITMLSSAFAATTILPSVILLFPKIQKYLKGGNK